MNSDRKRLYALSLSFLAVLLLCFFIDIDNKAVLIMGIIASFAILLRYFVERRAIISINKNQVLMLLSVFALLYVMFYYLSGLKFGFYRDKVKFSRSFASLCVLAVTVFSIEYVRSTLIGQKQKFISAIIFCACIMVDIAPKLDVAYLSRFNRFMDFIGLILFPSVTFNILFCYLARHYGLLPSAIYKLVTGAIPLFISVVPSAPSSLLSLAQLIYPILILLFIRMLYEKKRREKKRVGKAVRIATTCILITAMVSVMAVVSCQFRICAVVIATESMTGELNRGDVAVYERYDGQEIKLNQVLVFDKDGTLTVHRVVKIELINGQYRYTTKGDFNDSVDSGFITVKDIQGIVQFKIAYFGYPTLWLRDIFKR